MKRSIPLSLVAVALLFGCAATSTESEPHPANQPAGPTNPGPTNPGPTNPGPTNPDPNPTDDPQAQAKFDALIKSFEEKLAANGTPGGAVAVYSGGKLYAQGVGVRKQGSAEPVTQDTLFAIGSVTKPVTATALMTFVEEGAWSVGQSPTDKIPEFVVSGPWPTTSVTSGQLMAHTSGYPNYADDNYDPFGDAAPDAISRYLTSYNHLKLDFQPGSSWNYSNFGYAVLGLLVERLGGAPYADVVTERVLKRAGLPTATFSYTEAESRDHAAPHLKYQGAVETYPLYTSPFYQPFGGLFASAVDLVTLARAYFPGSGVFAPQTVERMLSDEYGGYMGLGWFLIASPAGTIAHHGGSQGGYLTSLYFAPQKGFAVAVLINADWDDRPIAETPVEAVQAFLGVTIPAQ